MNTCADENNTLAIATGNNAIFADLICKLCKKKFRTVPGLNHPLRTSRNATTTILTVDKWILIENVSDNHNRRQKLLEQLRKTVLFYYPQAM